MTRRGFLSFLGLAIAAPAVAKLLPAPPNKYAEMTVGDVFIMDGVFALNPITRRVVEYKRVRILRKFVVTGPNTHFPALILSGPYANCWVDGNILTHKIRRVGC